MHATVRFRLPKAHRTSCYLGPPAMQCIYHPIPTSLDKHRFVLLATTPEATARTMCHTRQDPLQAKAKAKAKAEGTRLGPPQALAPTYFRKVLCFWVPPAGSRKR